MMRNERPDVYYCPTCSYVEMGLSGELLPVDATSGRTMRCPECGEEYLDHHAIVESWQDVFAKASHLVNHLQGV